MKKLCIFDLDGTLASTLESMAVAANRVLRELNLPEQPTESFKYFAGDGAKDIMGADGGLTPTERRNRIYDMRVQVYSRDTIGVQSPVLTMTGTVIE